jgi:hypothetical protein
VTKRAAYYPFETTQQLALHRSVTRLGAGKPPTLPALLKSGLMIVTFLAWFCRAGPFRGSNDANLRLSPEASLRDRTTAAFRELSSAQQVA